MQDLTLSQRVSILPAGLGTPDEINRYFNCKLDCLRNTMKHEPSARRTETVSRLKVKLKALETLVDYMNDNGAPNAQVAITARLNELCCPPHEIEQYLIAIENLPKFLESERKPAVSLQKRVMAIISWRPRFSGIPGLSRPSA